MRQLILSVRLIRFLQIIIKSLIDLDQILGVFLKYGLIILFESAAGLTLFILQYYCGSILFVFILISYQQSNELLLPLRDILKAFSGPLLADSSLHWWGAPQTTRFLLIEFLIIIVDWLIVSRFLLPRGLDLELDNPGYRLNNRFRMFIQLLFGLVELIIKG